LIDWAEKFEDQLVDVRQWYDTNFADWLSLEGKAANQTSKALPQKKGRRNHHVHYFPIKYALFYSSKFFKSSLIYSIDDLGVLATLLLNKQIKKADVVGKNITGKCSGNEVLKRLLAKTKEETNNPND
jgi:hypothetical protein